MDEPEVFACALAEYIERSGRDARRNRRNPALDRAGDHPTVEAGLSRLEEILARQRRQIARMLAEEERTE